MNPVRLVSVTLVAALTFTSVSASAAPAESGTPQAAAPKAGTPKAGTPKPATPKAAAPKKAAKKKQKAPEKIEEPVEPPVEVAESLPPAAPPAPSAVAPAPVASSASPVAKDAPASESSEYPFNDRPFTVAPLLGYSTNYLNVGVGLRAGYTLRSKVYIGASFVYQHGISTDGGFGDSTYSLHAYGFYPSAEGGYEFQVSSWTLRPYGGAGIFFATLSSTSSVKSLPSGSLTTTSLAVYPGFSALYNIPSSSAFIGGDARVLIAQSTSVGIFATGGLRF